jgi:hypothetical protein
MEFRSSPLAEHLTRELHHILNNYMPIVSSAPLARTPNVTGLETAFNYEHRSTRSTGPGDILPGAKANKPAVSETPLWCLIFDSFIN